MNKLLAALALVPALAACGEATADFEQPAAPARVETSVKQPKADAPAAGGKMYEMVIEGMHCQNCVASVKRTLEAQPGVDKAEVHLERNLAIITMKPGAALDEKAALAAVNKDFTAKSCTPVALQ
ncbi:MAG: heavy-metal-associated domain-containing protein [Planctomycetes bacterium]|nr:heavy-metal-associated domain-containing protein [Planctomycetota bacterium]MCW8135088.1 heavy-metal-associated domain-containing protein [Planctomycetota bacterium]